MFFFIALLPTSGLIFIFFFLNLYYIMFLAASSSFSRFLSIPLILTCSQYRFILIFSLRKKIFQWTNKNILHYIKIIFANKSWHTGRYYIITYMHSIFTHYHNVKVATKSIRSSFVTEIRTEIRNFTEISFSKYSSKSRRNDCPQANFSAAFAILVWASPASRAHHEHLLPHYGEIPLFILLCYLLPTL